MLGVGATRTTNAGRHENTFPGFPAFVARGVVVILDA
jgi:hypothetical protein